MTQHGRLGSSKLLYSQKNIKKKEWKKKKRSHLNQLCRSSGKQRFTATKQTPNQDKAIFKSVRQFYSIFLALISPFPQCSDDLRLKQQQHSFQYPSSNRREPTKPYLQITVYVLFWSEGMTGLSLAYIWTQADKVVNTVHTSYKRTTNQQMPRARHCRWRDKKDRLKPAEEAGVIVFGKLGYSEHA